MHADPAELRLRGEEVYYNDDRVDLVYRDYAVSDLIAWKRGRERRADADAVSAKSRHLFHRRRTGPEKLWEVLTDPQFTQKVFHGRRASSLSAGTFCGLGCCRIADAATGRADGRLAAICAPGAGDAGTEAESAYGGEGVIDWLRSDTGRVGACPGHGLDRRGYAGSCNGWPAFPSAFSRRWAGRRYPRRAIPCGDGLFRNARWSGHPGESIAEASSQRRSTRRYVRRDDRPPARTTLWPQHAGELIVFFDIRLATLRRSVVCARRFCEASLTEDNEVIVRNAWLPNRDSGFRRRVELTLAFDAVAAHLALELDDQSVAVLVRASP